MNIQTFDFFFNLYLSISLPCVHSMFCKSPNCALWQNPVKCRILWELFPLFFTVSVNVLCFHVTYRRDQKGPVSSSCWPIPAGLWFANTKQRLQQWETYSFSFSVLGICHSAPWCNVLSEQLMSCFQLSVMITKTCEDNYYFLHKHSSHSSK